MKRIMEPSNLGDFFKFVSPHLDPILIEPNLSKRLVTILNQLPVFHLILLETRLDDEQQVDLNICIHQYECRMLIKWINMQKDSYWDPLRRWCKSWLDPELPFLNLIPNIWLVYDMEKDLLRPEPWIIFGFRQLSLGPKAPAALTSQILNYVSTDFTDDHRKLMEKLFTPLPPDGFVPGCCLLKKGRLKKAGYQNIRNDAFRTGVGSFYSFKEIEKYLIEVEWPGDMDFIREHYSVPISLCSYCHLSMVIGETLYPEIGIECYFDFNDNAVLVRKFLQSLVDQEICLSSKMKSILSWIGNDKVFPPLWSSTPPKKKKAYSDNCVCRWVVEIKLISIADKPPSAKAYLIMDKL